MSPHLHTHTHTYTHTPIHTIPLYPLPPHTRTHTHIHTHIHIQPTHNNKIHTCMLEQKKRLPSAGQVRLQPTSRSHLLIP